MIKLSEFVEDNVLAIVSNQQLCELAIKECGNVACLNRSVATKSIIGIIWLYINNEKATLIIEELKTGQLRANQYTTGGTKGEKVMKNKTKEEDLGTWTNARGGMKNNIIQKK